MSVLSALCLSFLFLLTESRFGQENPPTIGKIRDCNGGGDGNINGQLAAFAGTAIGTLLAAADPCAQQDKADDIIDFAKQNRLPQACIAAAVELRRAEKNVNPFVRQNPCSDICGRLPRNVELRGSVQAFDPACDLNAFLSANPAQKANFDLQRGAGRGGGVQQPPQQPTVKQQPANPVTQPTVKQQPPAIPQCAQLQPTQTQPAQIGSGGNLQRFSGALGGVRAPSVTKVGNQFQVEGNAMFSQLANALERSCAVQHNQCANAANSSGNRNGFTVAACDQQQSQCEQFQRA